MLWTITVILVLAWFISWSPGSRWEDSSTFSLSSRSWWY